MPARQLKKNWKAIKLNPFSNVPYDSVKTPHSRTLHTSFIRKMVDTFYVFAGTTDGRVGLIDYATLGIFRLFAELGLFLNSVVEEKLKVEKNYMAGKKAGIYAAKALVGAAALLVFGINLICNILIRYGVPAVATLALAPVVFFSHVVSEMVGYFKARNLARKFKLLDEKFEDKNNIKNHDTQTKLLEQLGVISLRKVQVEAIGEEKAPDSSDNRIAKIVTFVIPDPKSGSTKKIYGRFYTNNPDDMKQFDSLVEINPTARERADYNCGHCD